MHCHPWNTPPFEETRSKRNMMLYNLPVPLQFKKLKFLHQTIITNVNTIPISFRAGQWGFSQAALPCLQELGYKIDTSVTPYTDWSDKGGPNYSQFSLKPYYFTSNGNSKPEPAEKMLEVPPTIDFMQNNVNLSRILFNCLQTYPVNRLHQMMNRKRQEMLRHHGGCWRTSLLNHIFELAYCLDGRWV